MTGQIVQDGENWLWRSPDRADLLLRHNEWGKTPAVDDMPRLAEPLAGLETLEARAGEALADEYYPLWRDIWRRPEDDDLSRDEFIDAIELMSITYPSGAYLHEAFDLSFDDAGLFAGHAFFVAFRMDGTLLGVEMFG